MIKTILSIKIFVILVFAIVIATKSFAQIKKDSIELEYSRPGKYHQMLADLIGEWVFNGKHFSGNPNPDSNKVVIEFNGSLVRKTFANGRYFFVEFIGGKLQIPIHDGKMVEENGRDIETEGYDNVKKKFILTRINNYIGSGIIFSEGSYDSTTKTISYQWEDEKAPGQKRKVRKHVIIHDKDYYTIEYYRERNGRMLKATEINCTRVSYKK